MKKKRICPFSGVSCRECPIYRGRHYLLCRGKGFRASRSGLGENLKEKFPEKPPELKNVLKFTDFAEGKAPAGGAHPSRLERNS